MEDYAAGELINIVDVTGATILDAILPVYIPEMVPEYLDLTLFEVTNVQVGAELVLVSKFEGLALLRVTEPKIRIGLWTDVPQHMITIIESRVWRQLERGVGTRH